MTLEYIRARPATSARLLIYTSVLSNLAPGPRLILGLRGGRRRLKAPPKTHTCSGARLVPKMSRLLRTQEVIVGPRHGRIKAVRILLAEGSYPIDSKVYPVKVAHHMALKIFGLGFH